MKSGLGIAAIVLAVVVIIGGLSSVFIVDQREQAVVRQLGAVQRVIREPGIYFKLPLIQDVVNFDRRILEFETDPQEIIALDQKRLVVDAYARYRIENPLLYLQTITDGNIQPRLSNMIQSALRRVLGEVPLQVVLTERRAQLMRSITDIVNAESKNFGVEVVDVRIKQADLPTANSEAIYKRMQSQREQEARQIRAEGAQESQRIRANADRDQTIIVSEARRTGETLRGEGDAEAVRIYAEAFSRDPSFFAFYRSMEAYRQSLGANNTTMILSPDSEFFRYFGTLNGPPQPARR